MKDTFIRIISEICFYEVEDMSFDLSINDDLAISSVMLVELAASLETELNINLESRMAEMVNCQTVGDMYELIKRVCLNSK